MSNLILCMLSALAGVMNIAAAFYQTSKVVTILFTVAGVFYLLSAGFEFATYRLERGSE